MIKYRYGKNNETVIVVAPSQDLLEGSCIPADIANRHYVAFLEELEADPTIVASYEEPAPPVVESISDRQFFQELAVMSAITDEEALAAVKTGTIPASLQTLVDTLPTDQKFAAEMFLSGATIFNRHHPMTEALAAGMGWTSEQLDTLWTNASQL